MVSLPVKKARAISSMVKPQRTLRARAIWASLAMAGLQTAKSIFSWLSKTAAGEKSGSGRVSVFSPGARSLSFLLYILFLLKCCLALLRATL